MSGSLGGGQSSSTQNPDQVWGAQSPYLQQMYGNASTAAMDPSGQQYAQGYQDPAMQAFQQQAGGGFQQGDISGLNKMASGANQNLALGGAIDAGLNQINNNFNRNIMPGISSGAVGAGQSGSSRQGIAEGLAASDANQQASDFVNQMQSGNFANILQSQGQAQGQLSQNMNVNQQAQNQAMQGAMGQAPTLANLGFGSQFGSLNNMAGIIGGPTVLGQGGESDSWNMAISGGLT